MYIWKIERRLYVHRINWNNWDGQIFLDLIQLDKTKNVLEIGVGIVRIASKVAPRCLQFMGIDISSKTIERESSITKVV